MLLFLRPHPFGCGRDALIEKMVPLRCHGGNVAREAPVDCLRAGPLPRAKRRRQVIPAVLQQRFAHFARVPGYRRARCARATAAWP